MARQQRGWSQEELAHQAGINRGHVSDLERGIYYARLDRVEMIANAFGIPIHKLLDPEFGVTES